MPKEKFRDKISSFLGGLKNAENLRNTGEVMENEPEGGRNIGNGKSSKDDSKNNSQNRIFVANLDEALTAVEQSLKDHLSMHFIIEESFKRLDVKSFKKLNEILFEKQVTGFQCKSDGTFFIVWKKCENEIYAVNISERNNIDKDDLMTLCSYILGFLSKCLQNNHSGLPSGKKIPAEFFNIDLPSLTDTDGLNLLFHAASNGNTPIIPILLQIAFNVNMMHDRHFAGDLALKNEHYDTVLVLLKNNAPFPVGFNVKNCPNNDLKTFAETHLEFHNHIMANNLEEIRKILLENPKLRFFYNSLNQSALAVTLLNKKFEVYELLLQNNIYLSVMEDIDNQTKSLNEKEKVKLREIHFRNKKDIHQPHLFALLQKCSVGYDDESVQERLNNAMRAFQELNKLPLIEILLKIAALLPNLQIVFDFNRDSVEYLNPTQDKSTFGLFCTNGRIYVGAKQLLNSVREHEVFATIAHELCHFVLFSVFGNMAKPYTSRDEKTETEFQAISIECRRKKVIDNIIRAVYDHYPSRMFHAELIVRVPHFYAHYNNQPDAIERLKGEFKSLFDFYELNLMPKLEKSLKELKKKAKRKQNAKYKTYTIIALIVGIITITCMKVWFTESNYEWMELDNDQKIKAFNGRVRFEGVDVRLNDIYGQNDTANGVFKKITSDQIKKLINDETLDLSDAQNKLLQEDIFLIYQNLTENLKEKVKNGLIIFQGQPIVMSSLLRDKTEEILITLNSTKIVDIIRNPNSIKIGHEIDNSAKFHIDRNFLEKLGENPQEKLSSDLFDDFEKEKVILLSDDAGNGKTTTFKHLAWKLKKKFPLKWVQYVDLKSRIQIYQKYQNNISNLTEILTEIFDLNDLNEKVFEVLLDGQNVVILWDGFDEISPTYSDFMLELMKNIQTQTQNVQFVSTRPDYENSIQDHLNCSTYKLKLLTRNDNEKLLNNFYSLKNLSASRIEEAKKKVKMLIAKIQENVENAPKNYIQSPLMLVMIAEVSLNDDNSFDATNLYTIYDSFIDAKLKLTDYKGDIIQTEKHKNSRKGLNLDEAFQYFAAKLFGYNELEIVLKYDKENLDRNQLSRYGILIFDSNGKAEFVHRTFQEFYFAQYLVEIIYKLNSKKDCDEINQIFKVVTDYIVAQNNSKVREFFTGYFAKYKAVKIGQNLISCCKNHTELSNLFFRVFFIDKSNNYKPDFNRVVDLLESLPFTRESLEILWNIDKNKTFFTEIALRETKMFLNIFNEIQEIIMKYFSNDGEKQKKLLFGKNQRGSILYAIANLINDEEFNIDKNLQLLNVAFDFDLIQLYNLTIFEFYELVKPNLTVEENQEMFKKHFFDILLQTSSKMWNEIESIFTREDLQNLIYESRIKGISILNYFHDFDLIKRIFKTLDGKPDPRFLQFLQHNNILLLYEHLLLLDDNFEIIWNVIVNLTTEDERRKILELKLLDTLQVFDLNIFSASTDFGTVENFEFVKNIYEQHFNSTEKSRKFCEQYLKTYRNENYIWHPKVETAEAFVKYLKSLFTIDEMKNGFKMSLERLYELYSVRENLDYSYPLFRLLKELNTAKELEIFRLSQEFVKEWKNQITREEISSLFLIIPTDMDVNVLRNISSFFEFYEIIKLYLTVDEVREYLKANFIKVFAVGGIQMWNEIELSFTNGELQEFIYESTFKNFHLLLYVRDFDLIKIIFKTIEGTSNARFVNFIQSYSKQLLFRKEAIMMNDNFEYVWNVIANRTTKDERRKLLVLELLNDFRMPFGITIFSASIEFGTVKIFELVKKVHEEHFDLNRMREFCTNYFYIKRDSSNPWHPKVETAEAFVKYMKSLLPINEIKSKLKTPLSNLYEFYSEREKLDYSYPFFSLLKEL